MKIKRLAIQFATFCLLSLVLSSTAFAQDLVIDRTQEFGPVVRAYLGYLDNEQEVVDDRASRHEISFKYYRRNSNRIRALRSMALKIARETFNDYLPELEAAARDELRTLFEKPPNPRSLRVGSVLNDTYRFLGAIRTGEVFYVFARLDPYEQAELTESGKVTSPAGAIHSDSAGPIVTSDQAPSKPPRIGNGVP